MRGLAFILFVMLVVPGPSAAQSPASEESYQHFLEIYRGDSPSRSDLEAALGYLQTAQQLSPETYKYAFSLGAVNSTLKRWQEAIDWFNRANTLAPNDEARRDISIELNYCRTQLAKQQVANWGPEPVKISFIMKKGTVEMSADTVARLPQTLPDIDRTQSPTPIEEALADRLGVSRDRMAAFDPFLVLSMETDQTPDSHYRKGIKDFYRFFRSHYFSHAPKRWITVLVAERPYPLVDATRRLYPSVGLPQYAPFLGYYNPSDNLIMATGGRAGYGTLLHEMVHALMAADFPNAPAWLNEGLASLYERTQWRNSTLHGLPNWRMDGMQESKVHSIQELAEDAPQVGLHSREIAEYRLLLLYLDELGLLDDLYKKVRDDPMGFSLTTALDDMQVTESGWRDFLHDSFVSYRAEVARNSGALSHPDEIRFVQRALKATVSPGLKVDGTWGHKTNEALMDFQRRYGLAVDGILGPQTAAKLKREYELSRL